MHEYAECLLALPYHRFMKIANVPEPRSGVGCNDLVRLVSVATEELDVDLTSCGSDH